MFRFPSCSCQMTSKPILRSKWTTTSSTSKVFWVQTRGTVIYVLSLWILEIIFWCSLHPSKRVTSTGWFLCVFTRRENMPSHFKFKEYCPLVFRNLRERFGIDDQDFLVWKHSVKNDMSSNITAIYGSFWGIFVQLDLCWPPLENASRYRQSHNL